MESEERGRSQGRRETFLEGGKKKYQKKKGPSEVTCTNMGEASMGRQPSTGIALRLIFTSLRLNLDRFYPYCKFLCFQYVRTFIAGLPRLIRLY